MPTPKRICPPAAGEAAAVRRREKPGDGECSPDFGKRASGDCYTEAEYREKVREAEMERKAGEDAGKARAEAAALFAAFTQSPSIIHLRGAPAAYDGFRAATDDRHVQRVAVQGMAFEDVAGDGANDAAQPGNPVGAYRIADDTGGGFLDRDDATASVFAPCPTRITHDVPAGDAGEFRTSGEWKGVRGTFHCAGDCASRNGEPTGGDWTFRPGNPKDRVALDGAAWGWWVATDGDGDITGVTAFHNRGGLGGEDHSGVLAGPGSATYAGDATGKYVVPDATGRFTAKASLRAAFGDAPKLSGGIGSFRDADGGDLGWSVTLEETALAYNGSGFDVTGGKTVRTLDGVEGGEWRADLYGGGQDKVPSHALGSFLAEHQGSRVIGAFGATKTGESAE